MHLSALTFGTLLSSQESDAHRASHSRSKLRGNPPNFTVPTRAGQIGSFRSSLPARLSARNPPRRVSASETFREFAGETGRFRVRFAPTGRTLLAFRVQNLIGVPVPLVTLLRAAGALVRRRLHDEGHPRAPASRPAPATAHRSADQGARPQPGTRSIGTPRRRRTRDGE